MSTTRALVFLAAILSISSSHGQNQNQFQYGNAMFPAMQGQMPPGGQATPAPTPVTSYSAPASQGGLPPSMGGSPFNVPTQQVPAGYPSGQDFGNQMGNQPRQNVPFDPSQFRGFNPQVVPNAQPQQQPREEKFVPSEVVSGLPPARQSSDMRAVLRTSMGDITIKLDRLNAPNTVGHFIALARGDKEFVDVKTSKRVKRPFYNGLTFHRVSKGYLIQTGCPFGNGRGGPGDIAMVGDEIKPNMLFNRPGLVAMAPMRTGNGTGIRENTNGSQFFITQSANAEWDGKYTIFGEVEDGLDVVQKISNVKVGPTERPIKRVFLAAIDIFEGTAEQQSQVPATANPADQPQPPAQ